MPTHCFRLTRGQDLLLQLKEYAAIHQIKGATIASAVGCVSEARIRDAGGVEVHHLREPLEIIAIGGTVSQQRTHLHACFSRKDLSTIGGHLQEGCLINTTAEIVLLAFDDYEFGAQFDEQTGYEELVVKRI